MLVRQMRSQSARQGAEGCRALLHRLVNLCPGGADVVAQCHQPVVRAQHPENQQRRGRDEHDLLRAHRTAVRSGRSLRGASLRCIEVTIAAL